MQVSHLYSLILLMKQEMSGVITTILCIFSLRVSLGISKEAVVSAQVSHNAPASFHNNWI